MGTYLIIENNLTQQENIIISQTNYIYEFNGQGYWALYLNNHDNQFYISLLYQDPDNPHGFNGSFTSNSEIFALYNPILILGENMRVGADLLVSYNSENHTVVWSNQTLIPLTISQGNGGGAGSDPYITTFSGEIFELPHVNKWWNLFTDKSTNFSIFAHSHNYKSGNFFNKVKIINNNSIVNIDFDKNKISINKTDDNIEIKKSKLNIKYQNSEIVSDKKVYDIVSIKHPEFKTVDIVINWRNHYIHPNFGHLPIKNYNGLLIRPISKKSII